MIFYIILFLIILGIVIWGGVTRWKFVKEKSKDDYENKINSEIKLIKQQYDESAKTVFNIMNSLGYEWWPTEGTLIGILRYGEVFDLSNFSFSPIGCDDDIDIMIRVDDESEWEKLKKILEEKFKKVLWKNCYTGTNPIIAPRAKYVCQTKYYIDGENIHTDIHRYIVNEKTNTASAPQKNYYPFQYWKNSEIKYKGNLVDSNGKLGVALYKDIEVPCPLNAISLLSHWNNNEYAASDIRWPKGGVQKQGNKFILSDANVQITEDDKKKLRKLWAKLHKQGYMSFIENKELPHKRWQVERYENSKFLLTIVTAYIEIQSKHSKKEYKTWMKNLLTYSGPMVIFVDSKNIKYITDLRKGLPTDIIPTELEDLSTNKYRGKFNHKLGWYYQTNTLKKNFKNMDMYAVLGLEFINFLKRAVKLNSFNTPYYMWFDIGYLRNNQKIPTSFPDKNKIKILSSKIFLMALNNNNLCDMKSDNKPPYNYGKPPYNVLIPAGTMGCNKNNIDKFHYLFYNKLENIIKEKKEAVSHGQFILSKIYCENPELFNVIKAQSHPFIPGTDSFSPWFYGIPYFM